MTVSLGTSTDDYQEVGSIAICEDENACTNGHFASSDPTDDNVVLGSPVEARYAKLTISYSGSSMYDYNGDRTDSPACDDGCCLWGAQV